MGEQQRYIRKFEDLNSEDVSLVGGKNASLGEMIQVLREQGVRVPGGFATTAQAYRDFVAENQLEEELKSLIGEWQQEKASLEETGEAVRRLFRHGDFPQALAESIQDAYQELSKRSQKEEVDVAARSSATAEDLPEASFAGQQETFLNVTGANDLLDACRNCFGSLFTDRAITYREEQGFDHLQVALSVGVQKMVRADQACSGVMFTIDTETGFPDVVVINSSWGLGDNVVQGKVIPDEFRVFKPLLREDPYQPIIEKTLGEKSQKEIYASGGSENVKNVSTSSSERNQFTLEDEEILQLGRWAVVIEDHYQRPMDIEWGKDGETGDLYILQARPETVQSQKQAGSLKTYSLQEEGEIVLSGIAIGEAIAVGEARVIEHAEDRDQFQKGAILVTGMTDPDWVPIMKQASGIITDHGGRTSHAAIVGRELGIPAVIGTEEATDVIETGQEITLSCAEGDQGVIYRGKLEYQSDEVDLNRVPQTDTQVMMNIASPAAAFRWWRLPAEGIGLARMEFIVNNVIKIHPLALEEFPDLPEGEAKQQIRELTRGYEDKNEYFVDHLARGIAKIAAAQYPDEVIVRMSDFKTNEYADLIAGERYEPAEANPMLGFRGASRYYSEQYRPGFGLECRAIRRVRETIGLTNVKMMIPFCRTLEEADRILEVLQEEGLERGKEGLEVYIMIEIPSNVILAEDFAERFDGFSIGTNDLTQLVLGVDRDSEELSYLFDERNPAVKRFVAELIDRAHSRETKVGICGQAPSDYPEFAAFLVEQGIDSMSLNPDSVITVKQRVAEVE